MPTTHIQITPSDYEKLQALLHSPSPFPLAERDSRDALARELARAQITSPEDLPADIITLHSRARVQDLETDETLELTVVPPELAHYESGRISILAPLGTAMIGCRAGDLVEWTVPAGKCRLRIKEVLFQPEANGRNN